MNVINEELPKLMVDDSEKDGKAEIVMDYVLSWCLRRGDIICSGEKPILYNYCRQMLGIILGIAVNDDTLFRNVRVWKEEQQIDLWVELEVETCGEVTKHAILIENKYYSGLHNSKDEDGKYRNQLVVYKKRFDKHYDLQTDAWQRHYALIVCIPRNDAKFERYLIAPSFGYKLFSFYELLGDEKDVYIDSESDIFNEFWLRW